MQVKAIIDSLIDDQVGSQIIRLLSGIEEMYRPTSHSMEEKVAWHENAVSVLNKVRDLLKTSGDYASALAFSDNIMDEPVDLTRSLDYLESAELSLQVMQRNDYGFEADFSNFHHHLQCFAMSIAILYSRTPHAKAMRTLVFNTGLWPRYDGRNEE